MLLLFAKITLEKCNYYEIKVKTTSLFFHFCELDEHPKFIGCVYEIHSFRAAQN